MTRTEVGKDTLNKFSPQSLLPIFILERISSQKLTKVEVMVTFNKLVGHRWNLTFMVIRELPEDWSILRTSPLETRAVLWEKVRQGKGRTHVHAVKPHWLIKNSHWPCHIISLSHYTQQALLFSLWGQGLNPIQFYVLLWLYFYLDWNLHNGSSKHSVVLSASYRCTQSRRLWSWAEGMVLEAGP